MPNFWELRQGVPAVGDEGADQPAGRARRSCPDAVFPTEDAKFDGGGGEDPARCTRRGRPVLIGTRTVEKSEKLSAKLLAGRGRAPGAERPAGRERGRDRRARPGSRGRVTVATNMAGRGTDIKLGDGGGRGRRAARHRHRAARGRADRPPARRPGRPAGRPGQRPVLRSRLEDQLLGGAGAAAAADELDGARQGRRRTGTGTPTRRCSALAQRRVERKHYRQRLDLMHYDKQRQEMLQDLGADPYVD